VYSKQINLYSALF